MKTLLSYNHKTAIEAGCDEAGRGCLCGPVFAAAVIFDKRYKNSQIRDSKKLSENKRIYLSSQIKKDALSYALAYVMPKTIDKINILNASILAMQRAIKALQLTPEHILVDGNRFKPYKSIPYQCVVQGDDIYLSIAAASILAKTYRDNYMYRLHNKYSEYGWDKNKGYPTKTHRKAIAKHGVTEYHRKSFNLVP